MNVQQAKQFLDNLLQEVWVMGNVDKVEHYYTNDIKGHTVDEENFGLSELKERVQTFKANIEAVTYKLEDIIAAENKIAFRLEYSGINKKNGEKIKIPTVGIYHLLNNKVCELWMISNVKVDHFKQE